MSNMHYYWPLGGILYEQYDESCDTPKPLLVAIEELGDLGKEMVATLQETGYDDGGYHGKMMLPTQFFVSWHMFSYP